MVVDELPVWPVAYALQYARPELDTYAAYVGGSLAEGWANASSDVDLYLVVGGADEDCSYRRHVCPVLQRRIDITEISVSKYDADRASIQRMSGQPLDDWDRDELVRRESFDYLQRLTRGVVLVDRWGLRAHRDELKRDINELAARKWVSVARASWLDAAGAYRCRDWSQACDDSWRALCESIDAYCALLGQTAMHLKWRTKKIKALRDDPLGIQSIFAQLLRCRADAINLPGEEISSYLLDAAGAWLFAVQRRIVEGSWSPLVAHTPKGHRFERNGSGWFLVDLHKMYQLCEPELSTIHRQALFRDSVADLAGG